ncbi:MULTISPECIES: ATP-dependent helicase [unclassified Bradyrhizobium]|uniref:ATP-dependent helicase n=1 Tax=unclassified Bradyrhizobium TaxID=2631580 RepID=UPI001CD41C7E|nr:MULTISPECIES: ATP-dependent helicase [unclassified Bradyrhizobium]MCA1373571.1 UvrD-helicase domain-containing protein [Bradyrhizobium sp. IC4060]MCA1487214.1 UvrD-helicase domain-containing protein [Bradyrhizobium sp. IC4061]
MDSFGTVRALAREKYDLVRAKATSNSAPELLAAARLETGLKVQKLPSDHPLLGGGDGALHRGSKAIYIANDLSADTAVYVEAHEFGHFWIETPTDPAIVPRGSDPGAPEEGTPLGLKRVEAYSPDELRERFANVFAREFLLPDHEARRLFIEEGHVAPKIAGDLTLPLGLVHQQLAASLLLPQMPKAVVGETLATEHPGLDDSQREAAHHEGSPLLVEAGPGTGKTRTLIARLEFLIGKKHPPASILALTFSNKAAHEIRERVALTMPDAAAEIWAGTFHAFGLELLRKYGERIGIAQPVRLLDQADILAFLEEDLLALGLDHYLRLHEPLSDLRFVLGAISRAKDEVKSPEDYARAVQRMAAKAAPDDEAAQLKVAKAREVARVFKHYDEKMRKAGWVDFADLINQPVELLRAHPEVRDELRGQYQHLLVDEYQDVNRASALLVKALAGEGERLWVVGDARQSIYRFRGAAPQNALDFEKDYPKGQRKPLKVNYRSRQQIVDTFGGYAGQMHVGGKKAVKLTSHRGPGRDALDCNVALDRDAEIRGIADAIKKHRANNIAYREQAVLCRVHSNLERVALGLEAAGVPVLYLGDLFERPEVCDLLSLLSFVAEPHRGGLLRVADLPAYRTSLADVQAFLGYAREAKKRPAEALADLASVSGLSPEGKVSLGRLAGDLDGIDFRTGPGAFLCQVLFSRGTLLRDYLGGNTPADQQRRLAIHQLLQFAIENNSDAGDPKRAMLQWIRRLEVFGDERALREPPSAIDGIDAVRLMTVHASKGLEFKVVHLPMLGSGMFPLKRQGDRCPAPEGLLPTSPLADHEEEEECLFYVALSRARDHLSLSRAERYTEKQRSHPATPFVQVASFLPRAPSADPTWVQKLPPAVPDSHRPDLARDMPEHDGRDIELYIDCPRRYLYQLVLGLAGGRDDTAYVQFHRAVYRVLDWLRTQVGSVEAQALADELEAAWNDIGPTDDPLEPLFKASATRILDNARGRQRDGITFGSVMPYTRGGRTINLPVDEIERRGGKLIVRRIRTGREPSRPDQRHLHALMLQAVRDTMGASATFEVQYLTTNAPVPVVLDGVMKARLADVENALDQIAKGYYPAQPKDKGENCPRCPHYFICASVPNRA